MIELIAEIGMHHNGDMDRCKFLCKSAIEAGASSVKFQIYSPDEIATVFTKDYQMFSEEKTFSENQWYELSNWLRKEKIEFGISPFGVESAKLACGLFPNYIKVASSEVTDIPMLSYLSTKFIRKIVSVGSCSQKEIGAMVMMINPIRLLYCVLLYPAPDEYINRIAKEVNIIANKNKIPSGLSSHFILDEMLTPFLEALKGDAKTIECHFTDNKKWLGQDHAWSMDVNDIRKFRQYEKLIEPKYIKPEDVEARDRKRDLAFKSIVASRPIREGERFTQDNITTKRPGYGISASRYNEALGQVARQDFGRDDFILWSM